MRNIQAYGAFFAELTSANHWTLEVDHDSNFHFGKFLSFLDHLYENFMLFVLNGRHVDAENVRTLFYQLAYSFL